MTRKEKEILLIWQLKAGDKKASDQIVKRFGSTLSIAAFGWAQDRKLAEKIVNLLFIRLNNQCYSNATAPLEKYLISEVKLECEKLFGRPML